MNFMNCELLNELRQGVEDCKPDKIFILTDSNVAHIEKDLIDAILAEYPAESSGGSLIVTPAGEEHKSFQALISILEALSTGGATRRSLLICIGGGMTTDIGGFAAAILKRGIAHINIATTLLAAVDAAVGGKTGIDFNGLKNEIGAFHMPRLSLFDAESFSSLPDMEILSGFGEVIKTALISSAEMTRKIYAIDPLEADSRTLHEICAFCRDEKLRIVAEDPCEKGLRKVLNMGHTAGHAMEILSMRKVGNAVANDTAIGDDPGMAKLIAKDMAHGMAHGVAIAHGNLVALILSNMLLDLPSAEVSDYARWLRRYYPDSGITCRDYDALWEIAIHDKKNRGDGRLMFTLVSPIGTPHYDIPVDRTQFEEALDIYQELLGR